MYVKNNSTRLWAMLYMSLYINISKDVAIQRALLLRSLHIDGPTEYVIGFTMKITTQRWGNRTNISTPSSGIAM